MDRRALRYSVALVLFALLLPARATAACIAPDTPCREYQRVPYIFRGLVESITPIDYADRIYGTIPSRLVRVRVERAWKGVKDGATVTLVTRGDAARNAWVEDEYEFKQGEEYVIWAYPSATGPELRTSRCSLTRRVADAVEDLQFLESLSGPAPGGYVYGRVWYRGGGARDGGKAETLNDAAILLVGANTRRETRTDSEGRYRFGAVDPGQYDVFVVLPPYAAASRSEPADPHQPSHDMPIRSAVRIDGPRDCAHADFWTQANGRISGFASTEDGRAVGGVVVEAALVDALMQTDAAREKGRPSYLMSSKVITNPNGTFEFSHLVPGRYLVGVSLDHNPSVDSPYPRTFYPGVPELSGASFIDLALGQHADIGDLHLPQTLTQADVTVTVVDGDGRGIPDVFVRVLNDLKAGVTTGRTGKDGVLLLRLYRGYSYVLRATQNAPDGRVLAQASGDADVSSQVVEPVRLVLKSPPPRWP